MPRRAVGLLEDQGAAVSDQTRVRLDLFVHPPERGELEARVNQVERRRLQSTGEQIVAHERHVAQPLVLHEGPRGLKQARVDVGADDLAAVARPLAQRAQPPHRPTADVERSATAHARHSLQERDAGRFPDPRLQAQAIQLGALASQEILVGHAGGDHPAHADGRDHGAGQWAPARLRAAMPVSRLG